MYPYVAVQGTFQYTQLFHTILHVTKLREKHTKIGIALKPLPAYVIKVIRNLLSSTAPFRGHEDTPILHGFRGTSGKRPGKESYLLPPPVISFVYVVDFVVRDYLYFKAGITLIFCSCKMNSKMNIRMVVVK